MRSRILIILLAAASIPCFAGGPAFVAGSGFDPSAKGRSLTWSNGRVQYFTDQGDLSSILTNAQADAFVADAFTRWTTISSIALSVSSGGHLAEDISGSNVTGYPDGTYTIPADIQPAAIGTPVGIVYDYDGKVTEALLGVGAGGAGLCFTNAVFGGPDNFSTDAHLVHALVVLNGVCASTSAQLPEVRYRLVRTLGRVLGLGWSQANLNVFTGTPTPGTDDFEGLPLMHFLDSVSCVPIALCYPDADVPKMDDRSTLRRLYPNGQTGRIHGSVYFADANGNAAQPMQGVNIVARRVDAGDPSRRYVATSISGFSFRGNAGNPINGYVDARGLRYDRFGSDDPGTEGAFDLGGLEIASGFSASQFQLSVEPVDANWSTGAGPYAPYQVQPSGYFPLMLVTVARGADVTQDIVMQQSAIAKKDFAAGSTYANPVALPAAGGWSGWISGYGDGDWFNFSAQANRTASIAATAFDERGQSTQSKLMPVIGIWQRSDQSGGPAPAATPSAFNTLTTGMTRLDAQFLAGGDFRLGITDLRGDGRPDYAYTASILYADTVAPARLSLRGGNALTTGVGFRPGLQVTAGGAAATVLTSTANQLQLTLPAASADGMASLVVTDPTTGGSSQMIDALTFGAAATDLLRLVQGSEPATPIGSEAANPIRVRAVAADGVTPVDGATIAWSSTNGALLSVCGAQSSCSVLTDASGMSDARVTPMAVGQATITAALAPASYSPPQSVQATLVGTASALDLAAIAPTKWIAQGATLDVPLTVRVSNMGVPLARTGVNFALMKGTASLSAGTATTDSSGFASINAHLVNHNDEVKVSACVAPNNNPCQIFDLFATPPSSWMLETVGGALQVVHYRQAFQPLVVRVTDGSAADNPVLGAAVIFDTTLERTNPPQPPRDGGEGGGRGSGDPVILGRSESRVVTDQNGLAALTPTIGNVYGTCDLFISTTSGIESLHFHMQAIDAIGAGPHNPQKKTRPRAPQHNRVALE